MAHEAGEGPRRFPFFSPPTSPSALRAGITWVPCLGLLSQVGFQEAGEDWKLQSFIPPPFNMSVPGKPVYATLSSESYLPTSLTLS